MKITISIMISLLFCAMCGAEPVTFPAKAGEYTHEGWKYVYELQSKGSKSEKRIGRLFLNGKEIKGKIGDLRRESIGNFIYFGETKWNQGWLNTLTFDKAVFTEKGAPTAEVTSHLQALQDKKSQAEQDSGGQCVARPESKCPS